MFGRNNGERTLEVKPYSEIQVEEKRLAGMEQDVKVPRVQASWVAVAAMCVCLTAPIAIRALGHTIFWLAIFVVGAGTFVYALYVAVRYDGAIVQGFSLFALLTGGAFALVAGGVGLALWQVSVMTFPVWKLESQFWNFLLSLPFVGSVVFLALMALAFVQELAYRSPFLEKALFTLITSNKPPYWFVPKVPQEPERPIFSNVPPPPAAELVDYEPPSIPEMTGLEMFLILASRRKTLARTALVGRTLSNGERLKKAEWEQCIADLEHHRYVANAGGGWAFCPGTSAEDALRRFSRPTPPENGNGRGE